MLFNSIEFVLFLPVVFVIYWLLQNKLLRYQNLLLICASYVFYGWWDYRFLSLIIISSLVDYTIGRILEQKERLVIRKLLLGLSVALNIGLLGFFKYFDFFIDSFVDMMSLIGLKPHYTTLRIILPVGISFYTFQTMSYTIDVYQRKIPATKDIISFFAYVSFFPQLVAGPIERAHNFLKQFTQKREFNIEQSSDGLRQMLWGMFKKVVIADNIARHVDDIFQNYAALDSITLFIGVFLFAIQIYCDFSGYSDIAIGVARLFGFQLMRNFAFPYFSRDIGEFWRRWHISLSSWFRDYVYIPMGGSRVTRFKRIKNIIITFTVSGLWHGANWTFIVWGFLHGLYYLPIIFTGKVKQYSENVASGKILPNIMELFRMSITFVLVLFAWIFFRAKSLSHAIEYIHGLVTMPVFDKLIWHGQYKFSLICAIVLIVIEWLQREKQHALEINSFSVITRWLIYLMVGITILAFGNFGEVSFIYFQF